MSQTPYIKYLISYSHKTYQKRQWHPTPVLLPGKSHGRRSLVGCSLSGSWELDTTERLHFHFSLSCIGEGNGNPLQCSCLENPRDGGAWWAAVYLVAQSQTRLKRLSSSSIRLTRQVFITTVFFFYRILKRLSHLFKITKWVSYRDWFKHCASDSKLVCPLSLAPYCFPTEQKGI